MSEISFDELSQLSADYAGLSDAFFFYDNTVQLRFNQKQWRYYLVKPDGSFEKQSGVTGVCHIIDKSQPLMAWAVRKTMEKLRKLLVEKAFEGNEEALGKLFIGELDDIIRQAKTAKDDELDAAGETGHIAHDWIEQYIKAVLANDVPRVEELLAKFPTDERAKNCCLAALEWMSSHNVRWIATERKVYSRRYKYAGTMDGLALVDSCNDPLCCGHAFKDRLTITDWKTSNYLYIEYLMQTAAYWQAYEEERPYLRDLDYGRVTDRWIIRLGKEDAEFDPWHCEEETIVPDITGFLNALALSLSVEEIEARVSSVKGMRKSLKKEIEKKAKLERDKIRCSKADDYMGKRKSKCLPDGTQCQACAAKFEEVHNGKEAAKTLQEL